MADPAARPAQSLPLLLNRIVGVDPKVHGKLRLDRSVGFGFAARAQFMSLGLEEIEAAAQHYPILFTAGAEPTVIGLLGLQHGSNLFVEADGNWKRDSYIPAYVRAFPFVFVRTNTSSDPHLGMEPDAACLRTATGEPLFDGDKPTKVLNDAISLTAALRNNLLASEQFASSLDKAGLLEEEQAKIDFAGGGNAVVRGFKLAKRDRLEQVTDEIFLDWRRCNWLPAIYAHMLSAGRWGRLMDAAAKSRVDTAH